MKSNGKYENKEFIDFSGGINTEKSAQEIADNECVNLENLFLNKTNQLQVRYGVSKVNETPSSFTAPIKSIVNFSFGAVDSDSLLLTSGNKVYREDDTDVFTDITSSNILPNDSYWSWCQYKNLVIGCNGSGSNSGFTNPVKYDGETLSQLKDGENNAPGASYCIVFNERVWLVSADSPSLIYYSKLGDPEDYLENGGQIEVGLNDGDFITGIYVYRNSLFIFKRRKTYILTTGTPNTDPDQWSVRIYNDELGCISHFSIKAVLDDVVFLSNFGLASLQAAEIVGDYRAALLSRKVKELDQYIRKISNLSKPYAVIHSNESEYWLAVPTNESSLRNGVVFVMGFKRISEGIITFSKFNGLCVGYCYSEVSKNGVSKVYIGSENNLYIYDNKVLNDNGSSFTIKFQSKAFNFGTKHNRKDFDSISLILDNLTKSTSFSLDTFAYRFDETTTLQENYVVAFTETTSGSIWGETTPSIGTWANISNNKIIFNRKLCNPTIGKKGLSIQFLLEDNTLNQSFIINSISTFVTDETSREVGNS